MVPEEIANRLQWLVWRFEKKVGAEKPAKMPYYTNGERRQGKQGSAEDRAKLSYLRGALDIKTRQGYAGVGFAFLPDDGLIGIDLDKCIDTDTGEISERARKIVEACDSYTEFSPSRAGLHIIVRGKVDRSFKSNEIGVEVFCGSQFFTFTGEPYPGTPPRVNDVAPAVLRRLEATVETAKSAAALQRKHAQQPADDPPRAASAGAAGPPAASPSSAENDFTRVNDAAMRNLDVWVKALFPGAKRSSQGWRVGSKDLRRDLQEDLSITPDGIVDFGVADQGDPRQGRRTPIDLVIEWGNSRKPGDALRWLAGQLGVVLTKRERPKLRSVDGGKKDEPAEPAPKKKKTAPRMGIDFSGFLQRFTHIYPTITAWDADLREIVKHEAMRANFGRGTVDWWLSCPERRTVNARDVVFDPALPLNPEGKVNLFSGWQFEPKEGECKKLLELLHWLCGEDDKVFEWVLKWAALPLQRPGAKMETAIVMHGHEGTGKNLFWNAVREIYGEYGSFITQFQLTSQFNDWASRRLFIVANEVVTQMERKHLVGYLKTLVTEGSIPIEAKGMPVRLEDNRMQLVFLSNEFRPLHISPGDRRYMIIRTPTTREPAFYSAISDELAAGGAAALYHYLLHHVDLGDFTAHSKPVTTQAKKDLIELGLSPTQLFWGELHEGLLPMEYGPCLVNDAYEAYVVWCARSGVKMPENKAQFSHGFMNMNGVTRKIVHIADPEKPSEWQMPKEKRPQRRVFLTNDRPEDQEESTWMNKWVGQFRSQLRAYKAERRAGASDLGDDTHP